MTAAGITLAALLLASASAPGHVAAPAETAASNDPDAARSEAERGEVLFAEGRFDEASAAYERAYILDPFPPFLFARARSEQEAGQCEAAIQLYREFIATEPPQADIDTANVWIGRCVSEAPANEPPPPRVEPSKADRPPPTQATTRRTKPPRDAWHQDPAGGALLSVGLVTLAAGLGLFLGGDAADRRAQRAQTTDEFRRTIGRARALKGSGIAGICVGTSLIVGAIARYAIIARRARRARAR